MSENYEFRYQSPKQKAVLIGLKIFVLLLIAQNFHSLVWGVHLTELHEQLGSIGGLFIAIWAYANLARVKIEVQELFIPPVDTLFMVEFMFIGATLITFNMGSIVWWIIDYHFF